MKRVLILSPFRGDIEKNIDYAQRCMIDSISRGEAPFASHLLYPQVLHDDIEKEREYGLKCEDAWGRMAELLAIYTDLGISEGMKNTFNTLRHLPAEFRQIDARYKDS